jgi:NADPH-dependent 2,4-dienoyl-CoA reductase/sulfur reductase-like enzyme
MAWEDAEYLAAHTSLGTRVLVVGAGLIGLKAAECLTKRGAAVTVAELQPQILPNAMTPAAAARIQRHLEENGVSFFLGQSVLRYEAADNAYRAFLQDGSALEFDVLVLATGVLPNTELLKEAGAAVNRGIVVDENSKTSLPNVFAAGDCTESVDASTGAQKIMALLPNAYHQGEAAGRAMAGNPKPFTTAIPLNAAGFFGLHALSAGNYTGAELKIEDENGFRVFYTQDGVCKGFILIGDYARAGIYTQLIRKRTRLSKEQFLSLAREPGLLALDAAKRKEILANEGAAQ